MMHCIIHHSEKGIKAKSTTLVHAIRILSNIHKSISSKLQKKHGDLFTLKISGRMIIVVCGYETIKEVLVKNGEVSSGRPAHFTAKEYFELSGNIEVAVNM
jgi:hypothetical protein